MPSANSRNWPAPEPAINSRLSTIVSATCAMRCKPAAWNTRSIFAPTPGSHLTSSGARNSRSVPAGTSRKLSGLRSFDATDATNLFVPRPCETDSRKWSRIFLRNLSAAVRGLHFVTPDKSP